MSTGNEDLENPAEQSRFSILSDQIRKCRLCRDAPLYLPPLPVEPKPLFQGSRKARLCIAGQAPGLQAHDKGRTFDDPSGNRLRNWLGLDWESFYNPDNLAIIPMGFCFPGYDARGGDLPPRRECAPIWRNRIFATLPDLELILCIGQYAQHWHMQDKGPHINLTETVRSWRNYLERSEKPRVLPLPHPSWRNNGWLKKNPWFEQEMLPAVKDIVRQLVC